MTETRREFLLRPIFKRNPIALLVLGICSALAVTGQMSAALVMLDAVKEMLGDLGVEQENLFYDDFGI